LLLIDGVSGRRAGRRHQLATLGQQRFALAGERLQQGGVGAVRRSPGELFEAKSPRWAGDAGQGCAVSTGHQRRRMRMAGVVQARA
jgi:hypothetical protein